MVNIEIIRNIDRSKSCLDFLCERILNKNYRGNHISQHNRYNCDNVIVLLEEIFILENTGQLIDGHLLPIRTTDSSKNPFSCERLYDLYCNNVRIRMKKGTQDSIRKTYFVDLHRMGFIKRYDKEKKLLDPYSRGRVKYVSLDKDGKELLAKKDNYFKRNMIYIQGVNTLFKGCAENILDIIAELDTTYITIFEYMFFVSFINQKLNNKTYTITDIIDFIRQFRSLPYVQNQSCNQIVQLYCNPSNFAKFSKNHKKDYGNWKNEAQQVFSLLDQTPIFEKTGTKENCRLSIRTSDTDDVFDRRKLKRSVEQKKEFNKQHGITERPAGYELHHIVSLFRANDINQFRDLDVWQNMIYIDGKTHNIITTQGKNNIIVNFKDNDLVLSDYSKINNDIYCYYESNAIYNPKHQLLMKKYNDDILKSL